MSMNTSRVCLNGMAKMRVLEGEEPLFTVLDGVQVKALPRMDDCHKRGIAYSICPEIAVRKELAEGSLVKLRWDAE